jgi:hypothetical protein
MTEQMIEAVAKAIYVAYVQNPNAGWDARNPTKKSNIWFLQAPAAIAAAEPIIKDGLRDRLEALTAENERLREVLKRIARYDVGLQSLIEDGADTPENRAKYYEGRVEYRRSIARAALEKQP